MSTYRRGTLMVGALLLGTALASSLLSAAQPEQMPGAEKVSRANMLALGHALRAYLVLNEGRLPKCLSHLYEEALVPDLEIFSCPASGRKIRDANEIDTMTDYKIVPELGRTLPTLLFTEKYGFHNGKALAFYSNRTFKLTDAPAPPVGTESTDPDELVATDEVTVVESPISLPVRPTSPVASQVEPHRVPELYGLTAKHAQTLLGKAGLAIKYLVGEQASVSDQAYRVCRVHPAPGTRLGEDVQVEVTVYGATVIGQPISTPGIVPELRGLTAGQAKTRLLNANLVPNFDMGRQALLPDQVHRVHEVQPSPGTRLAKDAEVTVTIYCKIPVARSSPSTVKVPAILGLTAAAAKDLVEKAGLVARFDVGDAAPTAAQAYRVYLAELESDGKTVVITVYGRGGK